MILAKSIVTIIFAVSVIEIWCTARGRL